MIDILTTEEFDEWLRKLKDRAGRLRILERIDRFANGNPGDTKQVGRGVYELRATYGPGYRIYYLQDADTLILLLVGGDKSTQRKDISRARDLADEWHADKCGRNEHGDGRY
ncbi:MAG: type II toxin-antitoxin system RelE/ParE family toxin [Nocardioides sp.]